MAAKARKIPSEVTQPKVRMTSKSEMASEAKPMIVVIEVNRIGVPISLMVIWTASRRPAPAARAS